MTVMTYILVLGLGIVVGWTSNRFIHAKSIGLLFQHNPKLAADFEKAVRDLNREWR